MISLWNHLSFKLYVLLPSLKKSEAQRRPNESLRTTYLQLGIHDFSCSIGSLLFVIHLFIIDVKIKYSE